MIKKYVYSGYEITLDRAGSWSFDYEFAMKCYNFWC